MKFEDCTLGYIDFKNFIGGEINNVHLAVLFNIPAINNVVFAIPLTSPKLKHFKSLKAFEDRNYLETKFLRLAYIKQTDSIALLEQVKSIFIYRIIDYYRDKENNIITLNFKELNILRNRVKKYIDYILK